MKRVDHASAAEEEFLDSHIQHLYALGLRLETFLHLNEEGELHIEIIDSAITSLSDLIERLRTRLEALDVS